MRPSNDKVGRVFGDRLVERAGQILGELVELLEQFVDLVVEGGSFAVGHRIRQHSHDHVAIPVQAIAEEAAWPACSGCTSGATHRHR